MSSTEQLTQEQKTEFREAFDLFDYNGDGVVTASELERVFKLLRKNPTVEDLNDMIAEIDEDGNGTIDFEEFLDLMLRKANKGDVDDLTEELVESF